MSRPCRRPPRADPHQLHGRNSVAVVGRVDARVARAHRRRHPPSLGVEAPSSTPQHSCGYVSSPCARIASQTARDSPCAAHVSFSSQNRSLRYFSARSSSTVTIAASGRLRPLPRHPLAAPLHGRGRGDAHQQPLVPRHASCRIVSGLGLHFKLPIGQVRVVDGRHDGRSHMLQALRVRGKASRAES